MILCVQVGVFDLGSTGTRLHIFKIESEKIKDVKEYKSHTAVKKESIGTMGFVLQDLLRQAEINSRVPIGIYGTAGLRENDEKLTDDEKMEFQHRFFNSANRSLGEYNLIDAKIISGAEEAVGIQRAFEYFFPEKHSYLLLDMGGKSTQVVHRKEEKYFFNSLNVGMVNRNQIKDYSIEPIMEDAFLFSAFNALLKDFKSGTFNDLLNIRKKTCPIINTDPCKDLFFAIDFLKARNLSHSSQMKVINKINDIYVSWPVSMALKLAEIAVFEEKNLYN